VKRLVIIALLLAAITLSGCTQAPAQDNRCIVGTEDGILMMSVNNGTLAVTGPVERTNATIQGVEFCQQMQQI
jgi:hypothetical protein